MTTTSEQTVRTAYEAMARGDREAMLALVDEDLEWTFLDPSVEHPEPEVCHGRQQLARYFRVDGGGPLELEELVGYGARVLVVTRSPGLDSLRARQTGDRNFHVVTVNDGRITALRACRDRAEAVRIAEAP